MISDPHQWNDRYIDLNLFGAVFGVHIVNAVQMNIQAKFQWFANYHARNEYSVE